MNRGHWTAMVVGAGLSLVLAGTGCANRADDCYLNGLCADSSSGTGAGSSSSSSSSTGGHANCDPSMGVVAASCGVFVSSSKGDDSNAGTPDKPFATLGAALKRAGGGNVYACGENFTEAVKLSSGATLYGALDCSNEWAYDPTKKTVLTAAPDTIPLTLAATATGAEVFDFAITAANAMKQGGASIAVLVDHATAMFTRCDLLAQAAMDGEAGVSGGAQEAQADPGLKGDDAGPTGTLKGGSGGSNALCSLQGGDGGNGGLIPSADGSDGTQGDGTQGGAKGTGDTGSGCTPGGQGGNGTNGPAGPVAPGVGSVDASGYHGVDGQDGGDGTNGKSGGGGGGSKATALEHGAGGGGGGAGGCGGKKGTRGKAGGSSIALVSISAHVTFASCTLGAGKAGNGGAGGDGQGGQPGGKAGDGGGSGTSAKSACNGGKGGDGGNGGNASGGLGGHSLGIATTGTTPTLDDATKGAITPGTKGSGGKGGNMDADMNHGNEGIPARCWDFEKNLECAK